MKEKKYKVYLTERELLTLKVLVVGQKESSHLLVSFGKMSAKQEAEEDFYDVLIAKLTE